MFIKVLFMFFLSVSITIELIYINFFTTNIIAMKNYQKKRKNFFVSFANRGLWFCN